MHSSAHSFPPHTFPQILPHTGLWVLGTHSDDRDTQFLSQGPRDDWARAAEPLEGHIAVILSRDAREDIQEEAPSEQMMGRGPDRVRGSERVTHAAAGETPVVELGGPFCGAVPPWARPAVPGRGIRAWAPQPGRVNGSSTSLQPFLPSSLKGASIEIIEISASF